MPFTMVFSDIQSSTALWARAPQQMAEAVETHHALIRNLIKQYKAYEVKTIGDSFMIACSDAKVAAELALELQVVFFEHNWEAPEINSAYQDLEHEKAEEAEADHQQSSGAGSAASLIPLSGPGCEPAGVTAVPHFASSKYAVMKKHDAMQNSLNRDFWNGLRVRVGIHTGLGEIKHDPVSLGYDYYGTVVNTAARVEGVGHGGQILLTEAAFDAAGGYHPGNAFADATVTCLGPQPLRGLDRPVVLYQVVPNKLKGRVFHALRLDVENDIEKELDAEEESASESVSKPSSHTTNDGTPDSLATAAARRMKGEAGYAATLQAMLSIHAFLLQLLAPHPEKAKRRLLEQMSEKWRLTLRKHSSEKNLTVQQLHERHLMQLVLKVFPSFDKLEAAKEAMVRSQRMELDVRSATGAVWEPMKTATESASTLPVSSVPDDLKDAFPMPGVPCAAHEPRAEAPSTTPSPPDSPVRTTTAHSRHEQYRPMDNVST